MSSDPATVILPINLGNADAFDQNVFPLEYYEQEGNLNKGCFLIKATLEEMEKIGEQGIDLNENLDFIYGTRLNVETLKAEREALQDKGKTLNPFKVLRTYRAARFFHEASKTLYLQTKNTSEKIRREGVQVVSSKQMKGVKGRLPPDATVTGISVQLSDGWNDNVERTMNRAAEVFGGPFDDDPLVSQLREGEHAMSLLSQDGGNTSFLDSSQAPVGSNDVQQSPLASSLAVNYTVIQNSMVALNSANLSGFTHNQGNRCSGSSITQELAP